MSRATCPTVSLSISKAGEVEVFSISTPAPEVNFVNPVDSTLIKAAESKTIFPSAAISK